ncbi:hypothetical protein MPTK2_1g12040 [Marchantia polymorpha subsp. ruderalis]
MKSSSQRRSSIDLRRNNCFKRHFGEPYLPEVGSYRIRQTQADCNFPEESIEIQSSFDQARLMRRAWTLGPSTTTRSLPVVMQGPTSVQTRTSLLTGMVYILPTPFTGKTPHGVLAGN